MSFGQIIGAAFGNLAGSAADYYAQKSANDMNKDMQYDFAKNSIKWRVEDAARAGVSKLAALGANMGMPSPSAAFNNIGSGFANMGQDISRAIDATRNRKERVEAKLADAEARSIQLENGKLQNELLRAQIIDTQRRATNPPFPTTGGRQIVPGQGDALVVTNPMERVASSKASPHTEPGAINAVGYARTPSGGLSIVRSKDMAERLEDDLPGNVEWYVKNRIMPLIRGAHPPSRDDHPLPMDQYWKWDPKLQEYRPSRLPDHLLRMMRRSGILK